MEFEIETNIAPVYGITSLLFDAISKKYEFIDDLNSIKINSEEENFEDINPVIDSIIEDENNHIGKLQQLVDIMSNSEDTIEEGKAETIEIIDNPEIMESIKMVKKLRLNENFDNVIDNVQAVADPVFVGANEEHDENKKRYEDAMKENQKAAEETVPEEGETGEKVTSKELKAMHLSEALFGESISQDFVEWCGENIAEYILTEFTDLQNSDIRKVLKWVINHFSGPDFEESLKESLDFDDYSDFNSAVYNALGDVMFQFRDKNVEKADLDKALEWFDTHFWEFDGDEFETGTFNHNTGVYESLNESFIEEWWGQTEEDPKEFAAKYKLAIKPLERRQDEVLYKFTGTPENIKRAMRDGYFYSLEIGEDVGHSEDLNESLQVGIAKEQIQRFTEGKMPKNWSVEGYLNKLTENKHITQEEAKSLKEWYDGKQKR